MNATSERSSTGLTVRRPAGVCGLRVGESVLVVPGGGPGGGISADEGGTDTQRGCPSSRVADDERGTVDGGRGPKGYSGAGV